MANNRLYLVFRDTAGESEQILLAKGWRDGWEIWSPETLAERIALLLRGKDLNAASGSTDTRITVEDENHQVDHPAEHYRVSYTGSGELVRHYDPE